MATNIQPPRGPEPPQPPGTRSHFLAIVLLSLALIIVIAGLGIIVGLHAISNAVHLNVQQGGGGRKAVSIKTPLGSLEVNQDVNEASLGLPIYPGARAIKEDDTATVNLDFANQANLRVLAGKFETLDSIEKVTAFYHDRLGDEVTKFKEKDNEGKTVFEIKHDQQQKVVALKNDGSKTVIELVRISAGKPEAN
jgi:hypothetical protein